MESWAKKLLTKPRHAAEARVKAGTCHMMGQQYPGQPSPALGAVTRSYMDTWKMWIEKGNISPCILCYHPVHEKNKSAPGGMWSPEMFAHHEKCHASAIPFHTSGT